MNENDDREITQLFCAAQYNFDKANEYFEKIDKDLLNSTVIDFIDKFITEIGHKSHINNKLPDWFMFSNYLGSAAFRLETIESIIESEEYLRYRNMSKLSNVKDLDELFNLYGENILHLLHRHKIGHNEKKVKVKASYKYFNKKWMETKYIELFDCMKKAIIRIGNQLEKTRREI